MYCSHCGYKTKEGQEVISHEAFETEQEEAKISYVCPRCGHLIHEGLDEEEIKSLSRASHAQLQRSRNDLASGMGSLSIGAIALIISILFFFLAKKPSNQYQLVVDCAEFWVFVVLAIIAVGLFIFGGIKLFKGISTKLRYQKLLSDIKDQAFYQ